MKFQDIEDIIAVCETGSFRKAAKRLNISQPTLSHRISRLESKLGATLFERSRGHSQPTDLALYIAGRAEELVVESRTLIRDAYEAAQGNKGTIRIGCAPAPAYSFMAEAMLECRTRAPDLGLRVHTGNTHQLADMLHKGEVDLVVCVPDSNLFGDQVESELLIQDRLVIVARPKHPVFKTDLQDPARIFDFHIVLPVLEPRYLWLIRETYGFELEERPRLVMCSDFHAQLEMLLNSDYLTVCPGFTFRREISAGQLKYMELNRRLRHPVHLIKRDGGRELKAIQVMTDSLHAIADTLRC